MTGGPPGRPPGAGGWPAQPRCAEEDLELQLACAAALAGLPHQTPSRLRQLLQDRSPFAAWSLVRAGAELLPADLARPWTAHAGVTEPLAVRTAYAEKGIRIHVQGLAGYPAAVTRATSPPAVLFSVGSLQVLDRARVAVVGTRSATHYGEEVAAGFGRGLAASGVSVVSGLAVGIDGAAHAGALAVSGAPPLAVVGSGLDVVYPPSHAALWARVMAQGAILSEFPLGTRPEAWRFPWRNRLLAALADVVVVVESHQRGGSLLTAEAAAALGVPVMAVPGSVRSPASAGTNALLADGCAPARDVEDVLVALGLQGGRPRVTGPGAPSLPDGLSAEEAAVWRAIDDAAPTTTETLLARTGLGLGELAMALDHLRGEGLLRPGAGWWERVSG